MAETSESRMNLTALQRVDTKINDILYNASQAALYKFNPKTSEWEKTEIEGTFFIYTRSVPPHHGFIVMNRLSTTNLIEPITAGLEFQLQSPFLLYKNATGQIFGIWFYDESECVSIEEILNRLSQSCSNNQLNQASQRQRCASEGDKMREGNASNKSKGNLDILSLLCQAQEEYDKQQKSTKGSKSVKTEPKTIMENLTSMAGASNGKVPQKDIVKPTPLRTTNCLNEESLKKSASNLDSTTSSSNKGTSLSLAALFAQANASEQHNQASTSSPSTVANNTLIKTEPFSTNVKSAPIKIAGAKPNELQRLFSNPANTVEHIEKQQLNENPVIRDRSTSFSGGAGLNLSTNDSLEQDIKHKLNLNPVVHSRTDNSFNATLLNSIHSNESSGGVESLLPHLLGRRHSVSPALTPITPSSLMAAANKSIVDLEGPIITPAMFQQQAHLSPLPSPYLKSPLSTDPFGNLNPSFLSTSSILSFTKPLTGFNPRPDLTLLNGAESGDGQSKEVLALTKDHLRESLVYLLQNDDDFLTKVHEGYISSLKSQLGKFRYKSSIG